MTKLKATCDHVICIVPTATGGDEMIGTLYLPPKTTADMLKKSPIRVLPVEAVGPDVKVVKKGMSILYNHHNCAPIPYDDIEIVVITEGQVLAVIDETPDVKTPPPSADQLPRPATVGEVRAFLELDKQPAAMPEHPPGENPLTGKPDAQPAQTPA